LPEGCGKDELREAHLPGLKPELCGVLDAGLRPGSTAESCRLLEGYRVNLTGIYLQALGGGIGPIVMMVAIFAIFYFLLIMPQQRKQKKWQELLKQLKSGDRVVTSGGLTGVILSVKDDTVVLRVPPDNLKLEVARSSIVTLTTAEEKQLKS
jgi:preprotein translocase subunit YajC